MRLLKQCTAAALVFVLTASPCLAAGDNVREVLRDAAYGGITGGLIGAALLVFTNKPERHLDYIGYGAAAGVLAGALYGTVRTARSLARVENGKVTFAIPTVIPEIQESHSRGQKGLLVMAELVHGSF